MWIRGSDLTPPQRRLVFAAYGYRWTTGNTNRLYWWRGLALPSTPLVADADWLAAHAFAFTRNGRHLDPHHKWCAPASWGEPVALKAPMRRRAFRGALYA